MTRISVIIPTLNEAENISRSLQNIEGGETEVVVVDGGSSDSTVRIARSHGAKVLQTPPGRARQMNLGAESSTGEILLFLHADTVLPLSHRTAMERLLSMPRIVVGAFRLKIDNPAATYRFIEKAVNLRSLKLGLPYGDQAFFIRRETFNSIGGYPNLPIMEDFEFIRRLRKIGTVGILNESVITSARRWERLGPWRTTLLNQLLIIAYRIGVAPEKLARIYYR